MSHLSDTVQIDSGISRRRSRRYDWLPALLVLPLFAIFILWYVAPLIGTVINSFHPFATDGIRYEEWTLDNYTAFANDGYYHEIVLRTFLIMIAVALASAFLVYPVTVFPLTLPALAAGLIINMTMSLSAFTTPALLGGGRAKVLSYLSYEINLVQLNWPLGAAVGVILLGLTFVPILIVRALGRSRVSEVR